MNKKILILGAGNLLYKDEGVGVHVVQRMQKLKLPPYVQVVDCGVAILDAIPYIEETHRLIVIDALKGGGEPGTIYKLKDEEISQSREMLVSLHQISLLEALQMVAISSKRKPPTTIIGVEPKEIAPGLELSCEIEARLPEVIKAVLKELAED